MKTLLKTAGILVFGAFTGLFLITLVYCIPVDTMLANYQSVGMEHIDRLDGWHKYLVDYDASTIDNNSDCVMLKASVTPPTGENALIRAMRVYTLNDDWNHGMTFRQYEWKGQTFSCDSYERYWYGYLVILKPLLSVFSYTDILFLNMACQILILFGIFYSLQEKQMKHLMLPFLLFWIICMQHIIGLCLAYSVCFYIYSIAVLILLHHPRAAQNYIWFFLIIGMFTSYLDLLIWPLVTLAVPLVILLQTESNFRKAVEKIIKASVFWGTGYIGLWASKWIFASLILKENVIGDAIQQLLIRSALTASETEGPSDISWMDVIKRNLSVFHEKGYLIVFFCIAIWLFWFTIKKWKGLQWELFLPHLMVAALPFFWYLFTKNHSYVHYWMTWRILCIAVFAVCCGFLRAGQTTGSTHTASLHT